jgi:hypothetical protein
LLHLVIDNSGGGGRPLRQLLAGDPVSGGALGAGEHVGESGEFDRRSKQRSRVLWRPHEDGEAVGFSVDLRKPLLRVDVKEDQPVVVCEGLTVTVVLAST